MAEPIVEPKDPTAAPAAPEVTPTEPAPAASAKGLSDELLQIPAMQALFAGAPPALSAPIEEFQSRPEAKLLIDHKAELEKAGMGLYRSLDGKVGVIFNQLKIHGADIQAADKAGNLEQVAPPFDAVNDSIGKSGADNPVLNAQTPGGPALASPPASATNPPAQPPVAAPAAGAQKAIAAARAKNATPGAPTSGPAPGAGRLLASILKPVL
jgi:hypothetical protein